MAVTPEGALRYWLKAGSLVDLQLCDTLVKHKAPVAARSALVSAFLKPVCLDQPDGHLRIRITVL